MSFLSLPPVLAFGFPTDGLDLSIIMVLGLILLGAGKLPHTGRSLGHSMLDFLRGEQDFERELRGASSFHRRLRGEQEEGISVANLALYSLLGVSAFLFIVSFLSRSGH